MHMVLFWSELGTDFCFIPNADAITTAHVVVTASFIQALTEATINLEVQLYNYSNPQHYDCYGDICDYSYSYQSYVCSNAFVFRLRTSSNPPLTYDVMNSSTVTNDLFTFTSSVVENPLVFRNLAPKVSSDLFFQKLPSSIRGC